MPDEQKPARKRANPVKPDLEKTGDKVEVPETAAKADPADQPMKPGDGEPARTVRTVPVDDTNPDPGP